jgi:hypothetical protein
MRHLVNKIKRKLGLPKDLKVLVAWSAYLDAKGSAGQLRPGVYYIRLNVSLSPSELRKVLLHELVHVSQMYRGDLAQTARGLTWKGKVYPEAVTYEAYRKLPWEEEAFEVTKVHHQLRP